MEPNQPSRTAFGAALHRAAHQILDHPPLFADPLALKIIGPEAEAGLRSGRSWHGRRSNASNALRTRIATRSRLAEDTLVHAYADGLRQYVLLGAGLDTFAYRANIAGLAIFEVDHPATQAWKRSRLAEAQIPLPANVRYVPIDFDRQDLGEVLATAGFEFARPAVIAWLGVTQYLSREAVMKTLGFVAQHMARGSSIVFDYGVPVEGLKPDQRARFFEVATRVASLGEPFRSFFAPGPLAEELRELGFSSVEDFDSTALNALYFSDRSDGLSLPARGHIMRARI